MKSKVTFAAIALCFAVSSQSFGFDLLDRMLGGSGCGCDTSCCGTPEPSCGCDGIGILRGRFFNRGCDTGCDTGCASAPAACDSGCDSGCGGGMLGLRSGCRPKILSFDMKCISIPVLIPKITLPKINLPKPCFTRCNTGCGCDSGCDSGCKAAPACGCDSGCKPVISMKLNRCGLLDRLKNRPRLFGNKGCGCDSSCEPACGSDYSAPGNAAPATGTTAPAPTPAAEPAKADMTSNGPVPPAPVVDPATFSGVRTISAN